MLEPVLAQSTKSTETVCCVQREGNFPQPIALFTVTVFHLRYNVFERGCEEASGNFALFARNCLTSTFKYIVMQIRQGNCVRGYFM